MECHRHRCPRVSRLVGNAVEEAGGFEIWRISNYIYILFFLVVQTDGIDVHCCVPRIRVGRLNTREHEDKLI